MAGSRNRSSRRAACVGVVLIAALLVGPPAQADIYSQLRDKQQQQQDISNKADQVRGQLGIIIDNIKASEAQLATAQANLERAKDKLASIKEQQDKTQQQLDQVKQELAEVTAQLVKRQQLLGVRVRSLSEQGRLSYLDILFGSASLSDFFDRLEVLRLVVQEDAVLFKGVRATQAEVAATQRRVSERSIQLLNLYQQAQQEKASIEQTVVRIQSTRAQLDNDRRQYLAMLDDLEATSQRLEAEIAQLQAKANRHHIGKLVLDFPVRPVIITDPFGMRMHPILHVWRMHTGTDFAADYAQPVHAAESGVVIQAGSNGAYGNSVIIDHGDGVSTLYGHNTKVLVSEGEAVKKGQVIAYAGATGWATGPHVHFEVRINGKPDDPMKYLPPA